MQAGRQSARRAAIGAHRLAIGLPRHRLAGALEGRQRWARIAFRPALEIGKTGSGKREGPGYGIEIPEKPAPIRNRAAMTMTRRARRCERCRGTQRGSLEVATSTQLGSRARTSRVKLQTSVMSWTAVGSPSTTLPSASGGGGNQPGAEGQGDVGDRILQRGSNDLDVGEADQGERRLLTGGLALANGGIEGSKHFIGQKRLQSGAVAAGECRQDQRCAIAA